MLKSAGFAILTVALTAQVQVIRETKQLDKIREEVWLLPSGLATRIPAQGAINRPGLLEDLSSGQTFAVALVADGAGRDKLLEDRTLTVRIFTSSGPIEKQRLKPVAIRQIKATGADMMMRLLDAGGVKAEDKATLSRSISMVSIAIYETDLTVPPLSKTEDLQIEIIVTGGSEPIPVIKPLKLKLRPWSDWLNDPLPDQKSMEATMNHFHENPQPGRLLPILKACARSQALQQHSIYEFLSAAFQQFPQAKKEALKILPNLESLDKWALLLVLRLGGEDIAEMMDGLPADAVTALKAVQPLPDPRAFVPFKDPVDPQAVGAIGVPMDQCWGIWMATGDPSYLKALVGLLAGAEDFQIYQAWVKAKGGVKGLNARVAEGLRYQIAGWSISSFQRTDPQVTDWLLYWQQDTSLPEPIRQQIRTLPNNPAFERPK